jgi:hypothetical protein
MPFSFCLGPADALDHQGGGAGLLSDKLILLLDHSANGRVTVEATKDFQRDSAIGSQGPVFVKHIEECVLTYRCVFSCHSSLRLLDMNRPEARHVRGV